jgi:hypothetical protein
MRKLKFRKFYRWDKDFKSAKIDAKKGDIHIEYATLGRCSLPLSRTPISDWLQYTGLTDKNGVEIYEGSIVKILYDKAIGEVYFDLNLGAFRLKDNSGKSYPITTYRFNETNKPIGLINVADEVIGNIYENSELLK